MPLPPRIRCVLLDIEGTTTPVAFVYETLFPYAAARLEAYCGRAAQDPRIAAAVEQLRREHQLEDEDIPPFGDGAPYARHLMRADRKSTGLKSLQGIIWEEGYRAGTLKAAVYPDVPPALEAWRGGGIRLRVYSSGSVLAQKLLFAHTEHADLTPFFEAYHDTTTGPKKEARSYEIIARDAGLAAGEVLFLSDLPAELDAAREAGMLTAMMRRPGNAPQEPGVHPTYTDFSGFRPAVSRQAAAPDSRTGR